MHSLLYNQNEKQRRLPFVLDEIEQKMETGNWSLGFAFPRAAARCMIVVKHLCCDPCADCYGLCFFGRSDLDERKLQAATGYIYGYACDVRIVCRSSTIWNHAPCMYVALAGSHLAQKQAKRKG